MTVQELKVLAEQLFKEHKLEDWKFEISTRTGVRYLGRCFPVRKKIEISLWHILQSNGELEQTLRHEIAHALDWVLFKQCGHGPSWKQACYLVGAKPDRVCANGKPLYRVKGTCPSCKREFFRVRKPKNVKVCVECQKKLGWKTPFIIWELQEHGSVKGLDL